MKTFLGEETGRQVLGSGSSSAPSLRGQAGGFLEEGDILSKV